MRRLSFALLFAAAVHVTAERCAADVVFADDFNALNGGAGKLNFNAFDGWTVTAGTVDLIGSGFYDFHPGNGLYLDLDGSTGNGGTLTRTLNLGPGSYQLDFLLGGSTRGDTNLVEVVFGSSVASYSVASSAPLAQRTLLLSLAAAAPITLQFRNFGTDNMGAILDDVRVAQIPSASTAAGLLVAAVAWSRRRRSGLGTCAT